MTERMKRISRTRVLIKLKIKLNKLKCLFSHLSSRNMALLHMLLGQTTFLLQYSIDATIYDLVSLSRSFLSSSSAPFLSLAISSFSLFLFIARMRQSIFFLKFCSANVYGFMNKRSCHFTISYFAFFFLKKNLFVRIHSQHVASNNNGDRYTQTH